MTGNARPIPNPPGGIYGTRPNVGSYFVYVVTTTSGTIDTTNSDTAALAGIAVTKTATETGRYTFTARCTHLKLLVVNITPIGPADAAWGANTTGLAHFIRNDAIASAGTFDVQFAQASDADAE